MQRLERFASTVDAVLDVQREVSGWTRALTGEATPRSSRPGAVSLPSRKPSNSIDLVTATAPRAQKRGEP
jgi:hypothetical protein